MSILFVLGSKSTSLSNGFLFVTPDLLQYNLFFVVFLFLCLISMLILSLPLLGRDYNSTTFSPGFVYLGQGNMIQFVRRLMILKDFFVSSWLIVWVDGISGCGSCLAEGRRYWLKGQHKIPNVILIFHHSLHFHIYQIVHLCQGFHNHCVVTANDGGMGEMGGGWFVLGFGGGDKGWVSYFFYFLFCFCAVNCSFMTGAWW